jgi:hypothetical protein
MFAPVDDVVKDFFPRLVFEIPPLIATIAPNLELRAEHVTMVAA